jgi:hypothetical protein
MAWERGWGQPRKPVVDCDGLPAGMDGGEPRRYLPAFQ